MLFWNQTKKKSKILLNLGVRNLLRFLLFLLHDGKMCCLVSTYLLTALEMRAQKSLVFVRRFSLESYRYNLFTATSI